MADIQSSFLYNVGSNFIPNLRYEFKFGRNDDVDSAAVEAIWDGGGAYTFPSAAAVLDIQSTDAADDAAGTGARTLRVIGLDANRIEIAETVDLDGTNTVNTTQAFLRINRMFVATAGSGLVNAGVITADIGGTTHSQIGIGNNQTLQAIYSAPSNAHVHMGEIIYSLIGGAAGSRATMALKIGDTNGIFRVKHTDVVSRDFGTAGRDWKFALEIPASSDFIVEANADNNNTIIKADWDMILHYDSAADKTGAAFE